MPDDPSLLDRLPDPTASLAADGATLEMNPAFRALVARFGVPARLDALFGTPAVALLTQAWEDGRADAHMSVMTPEPRPVFRVAAGRTGDRFMVTLHDVSQEIAWREELFSRTLELQVLNGIGAALSATLELDQLAEQIYRQTNQLMNTGSFFLALHDRDTNMLTFPMYIEELRDRTHEPSRPFRNGLTEHVIRTRRPLLLGPHREHLQALGVEPVGRTSLSWLGVPIISEGIGIGAIAIQDFERPGRFTDHDAEVLTVIAAQAAAAIRNARLFASERRANQELRAAQDQLLISERQQKVTETVGALNHEINNPLATVSGNAQLLLRQPQKLGDGVEDKVRRILEAANRIQSVTNRMSNLIHATTMIAPVDIAVLDASRLRALAEDGEQDPPESHAATG